jgi:hypothetical protein
MLSFRRSSSEPISPRRWTLLTGTVVLLLSVSLPAPAHADGPDPNRPHVVSLAYGGTGCPQGSASHSFSADRTTFTQIYDDFVASVGAGAVAGEARKDCELDLGIHVPPGLTLSELDLNVRGFVQLGAGLSARTTVTVDDGIRTPPQKFVRSFDGPITSDYVLAAHADVNTLVTEGCDTVRDVTVVIATSINPAPSLVGGQLTVDSLDGSLTPSLRVAVEHCP